MRSQLSRLFRRYRKYIVFCLVGGSEVVAGFLGLLVFSGVLGLAHDPVYAVITFVTFEGNLVLNFRHTWQMPWSEFPVSALKFHLTKGPVALMAPFLYAFCTDSLGWNYLLVYCLLVPPITLVNFFMNNLFVFVPARRVGSL